MCLKCYNDILVTLCFKSWICTYIYNYPVLRFQHKFHLDSHYRSTESPLFFFYFCRAYRYCHWYRQLCLFIKVRNALNSLVYHFICSQLAIPTNISQLVSRHVLSWKAYIIFAKCIYRYIYTTKSGICGGLRHITQWTLPSRGSCTGHITMHKTVLHSLVSKDDWGC